jgi:glutathione-independent formaldehyde dehydrogenase
MSMKGRPIATGQDNVKTHDRKLRDLIAADRAKPSVIISHELPLEKAPEGYGHFDARDDG